jgi:hypothetical protein
MKTDKGVKYVSIVYFDERYEQNPKVTGFMEFVIRPEF